jgi:hypothetical protein
LILFTLCSPVEKLTVTPSLDPQTMKVTCLFCLRCCPGSFARSPPPPSQPPQPPHHHGRMLSVRYHAI